MFDLNITDNKRDEFLLVHTPPAALQMVRSILWSGTVPPLVSPVYGACGSPRSEGVRQFGNPPCEPGCWAFDEGSSLWFQWPPRSESYFVARRFHCASQPAAVLSAWERLLIHSCPLLRFFDAWEEATAASGSTTTKPRPLDRCRRPPQRGKMPPVQRTMSDLRSRSEGM